MDGRSYEGEYKNDQKDGFGTWGPHPRQKCGACCGKNRGELVARMFFCFKPHQFRVPEGKYTRGNQMAGYPGPVCVGRWKGNYALYAVDGLMMVDGLLKEVVLAFSPQRRSHFSGRLKS